MHILASTKNVHLRPMRIRFASRTNAHSIRIQPNYHQRWFPFTLTLWWVSTWPQTRERDTLPWEGGKQLRTNKRHQLDHKRTANKSSHYSIDRLDGRRDGWDWVDCGRVLISFRGKQMWSVSSQNGGTVVCLHIGQAIFAFPPILCESDCHRHTSCLEVQICLHVLVYDCVS